MNPSPRTTIHAVLPAGIDDPARPSGGNVYDRRALDGLRALGWSVVEHEVGGDWPRPDLTDLARLSLLLDGLPDGSTLLVDGLIASGAASVLPAASTRLSVVVLLHMPLGPGAAEETVLASAAAVVTTSEWARAQVRSWYGPAPTEHRSQSGPAPAPPCCASPPSTPARATTCCSRPCTGWGNVPGPCSARARSTSTPDT
jgi:hypothetical protein